MNRTEPNKWQEFARLPLPEVPFERDLGPNKPDLFEDWLEPSEDWLEQELPGETDEKI